MTLREELMAKRKGNYGNNKPPVSGQFKPGQSGHPPGRPKGSRNRRKVLEDELNKTVFVTEGGRRIRRKKWDVILAQQVNKAVGGDLKATQYIMEQAFKYGLLNLEADGAPAKLNFDEQSVLDDIARRIRASQPPEAPPENQSDENDPPRPSTDEDEQS
jgi:Family of unknown function (DUF5681)